MKRFILVWCAVFLFAGTLATNTASAQVRAAVPPRASIFGTILGWERAGHALEVQTWHSGVGRIDVRLHGARINWNGQRLTRGTFAGFYGYFSHDRRYFTAETVTLSASPGSYPTNSRYVQANLQGTILSVAYGRFLLQTWTNGRVWVQTPERGLRRGERVSVWGTYDAWTGRMTSDHISVL